jgi:hypothetical protein
MYNPLAPWNAWFALSSQPARVWAGMLRGIAQGCAKADAETDRMVTENVGAAGTQISEAARKSNKKHRGEKKAFAVAANRDRRNRHGVRSDRVDHRVKKIRKRRPSGVPRSSSKAARQQSRQA